jgi:hypothetical protein
VRKEAEPRFIPGVLELDWLFSVAITGLDVRYSGLGSWADLFWK